MVISTRVVIDNVQYLEAKDVRVRNSVNDNNSASRADINLPNYNGRYTADFDEGDEVLIQSSTTPLNGLVSYWKMTGSNDFIGSNHFTVSGATLTTGFIGSGYGIGSPTNLYVLDPADGSLDFGTNDFSVSMWANLRDTGSPGFALFSKGYIGGVGTVGYDLLWRTDTPANRQLQFRLGGSNVQAINYNTTGLSTFGGVWTHIVCVADRDSLGQIWVNGSLVASANINSSPANLTLDNARAFRIGANSSGNAIFASGVFDEVGVWNRALRKAEIQGMYYSGLGHQPTNIFRGIVTEIQYDGRGSNDEQMRVMARDYGAILQQATIEPEVYTNLPTGSIVKDLIAKYAPTSITTNNVTIGSVTISRIAYRQNNVFDACKQLAELTDFIFYVDTDKDVHFEAANSVSSGFNFTSGNVISSSFNNDADNVINRIFVYGDRTLVAAPRETFTADGAGSVFTLLNNPHNTKVTKSGTEQKGDVFNIVQATPESGTQYLVDYFAKQIIFLSGTALGYTTIPTSGSQILVDYQVSRPIIKYAEDPQSVTQYLPRTKVLIDNQIKDPSTATTVAKNQISLYKDPSVEGNIDVGGIATLTPGQTVWVNLPNQDAGSKTFSIIEASYNFTPVNCFSDSVLKARLSQRQGDVTDVLKQLILDVRRLQASDVDDTGVLSRLMTGTGSYGLKTQWQVKTRTIGNAFILGHATNGQLGSPEVGWGGGQVLLGSAGGSAYTVQYSGGY